MDLDHIIKLDKKYYMNTYGDRIPVVFKYGKGSTLYDSSGRPYIDFLAGIAVNILGYGHPKISKAITSQAERLIHCSNYFYIESQALLAQKLAENSCGDKVFFCNSGAEANEGAIKLARKYFYNQGKNKYEIITAQNSFHGRTMATLAATGQEKYQKPFRPMPEGFKIVPYNDLKAAKEAISDITCAIMVEVIQGEGGVIEADMEYLTGLESLCKDAGILLIIDEVQTGMGRTGKLFGYQHYHLEPHIFTLAKALGAGIPIGAVVAKDYVASAFEPGSHGSTFGGNPLACWAGLTVLSALLEEDLLQECHIKGEYFKEKLKGLKKDFPCIVDVRGKGLMLGMELDPSLPGKAVVNDLLDKGFLINCTGPNTLRFVPPLIISTKEIDMLIDAMGLYFKDVQRNRDRFIKTAEDTYKPHYLHN